MADATDFTPQDLDSVARTIVTEDPGNPDAIAHVINNRVLSSGLTPHQVVSAPGQFTGYANAGGVNPKSAAYQRAYSAAQDAFTGKTQDPTGGAHFYYNPDLQAELHKTNPGQYKAVPDFAVGDGYRIGKHLYYGGNYTGEAPPTAPVSATPEEPMPSAEDLLAHAQNSAGATSEDGMPSAEELLGQQGAGGKPPAGTVQITPEQALANLKIGEMANRSERYAPVGLADVVTNSAMFGLQPVVAGGTEALLTGGQNLLAGLGIGKPTGYGMGEAYNAERALEQARLERFGKEHPFQNIVGSTLGFMTGAGGMAGKFAEGLVAPATGAGRMLQGALGGAVPGALQSTGEAVSRGENAQDVGLAAVTGGIGGGVVGAAMRPATEFVSNALVPMLPKGQSTLAQRLTTAATHGMTAGALGGTVAGGTAAARGEKPAAIAGSIASGFTSGFLGGAVTGAMRPTELPDTQPNARHVAEAYDQIAATGVTPDQIRNGPSDAIAADTVPGASQILGRASQIGSLVAGKIKQAYDERHDPATVRSRITDPTAQVTGSAPETAETEFNAAHQNIAQGQTGDQALQDQLDAQKDKSLVVDRVAPDLSAGMGRDVRRANVDFDAHREQQAGKVSEAYNDLKDGEGVNTAGIRKAMQVLPAWRDAVVRAAQLLRGQHPNFDNVGWVLNPDYVEPTSTPTEAPAEGATEAPAKAPPKPKDEADDLAAYVKTGATPRMKGQNLRVFVSQKGGINDAGGELPDMPGLSRPTGKYAVSGDRLVEQVNDASYRRPDGKPFENDDDLLTHLRDEASKSNYPDTAENRDILEKRNKVDNAHSMIDQELTQTLGLTHHDFSAADLAEFLRTGDISHMERLPEDQVTAQKAERENIDQQANDFLNPDIKQPKYIPTTDTLLEAVNLYRKAQGNVGDRQQAYMVSKTMEPILRQLDEAIPGFKEARGMSADQKSSEDWFKRGQDASSPTKDSQDLEQLKVDWNSEKTSDADREAFAEGYAGAHGQRLEQGKLDFAKVATSPFHNGVRELIAGPKGNEAAVDALQKEADLQKQKVGPDTPQQLHQMAYDTGQNIWKSVPNPETFAKEWPTLTPEQQQAKILGWKAALNSGLNKGDAAVIKSLLTPDHQAVLETMVGPQGAKTITDAAQAQADMRTVQRANTSALSDTKPKPPAFSAEGLPSFIKRGFHMEASPGTANALAEVLTLPKDEMAAQLEARMKEVQQTQQKRQDVVSALTPISRAFAAQTGANLAGQMVGKKRQPSAIPVGGKYHWAFDLRTNQVVAAPGPAPVVGSNVR
jgi:hypothetical protein